MTFLRRWLERKARELLKRDEETIATPASILQESQLFAEGNPEATVDDWIVFATKLGSAAYTHGYLNGMHHEDPIGDPDLIADQLNPQWRESRAVQEAPLVEDDPDVGNGMIAEDVIRRLAEENREP